MTDREHVTLCFDVEADSLNVTLLRDLLRDPRQARMLRIVLAETLGRFLGDALAFRFTVTGGTLSEVAEGDG